MKISDPVRFERTVAAFDAANIEDPHMDYDADGQLVSKELLYAQRMSATLAAFCPDASEALQLAARCQHIQRWKIPRDSYPMGRKGYLQWRTQLKIFHGKLASAIMRKEGYDEDTIERVVFLLNKKKLKSDPETQTLEDVVCLVFLQYYFADFAKQHDEEKLVDIVVKTWNKMSDKGREAALGLSFTEKERNIVQQALANKK